MNRFLTAFAVAVLALVLGLAPTVFIVFSWRSREAETVQHLGVALFLLIVSLKLYSTAQALERYRSRCFSLESQRSRDVIDAAVAWHADAPHSKEQLHKAVERLGRAP